MLKLSLTITTPEIERAVLVALLEGPFERRLEAAAELGCDGVELMTARPESLDAAQIRARIEGLGLEAAAVSSGAQASLEGLTLLAAEAETRQRAYARLEGLIQFAAGVGAPLVTVGSFRGRAAPLAGQGQSARALLVELLAKGACAAEAVGVRLALEPLNRYETDFIQNVGEGLDLIAEVGERSLGLLVDTFHANIEEASLRGCLLQAAAADRLLHVHIADSNRLAPGQGHIDFGEIFRTLDELDYSGYVSAELLAKPDGNTAAAQTAGFIRLYRGNNTVI